MNWNWYRVSRWDREIFQIFIKALHRSLYTRARWQFPYWLHVPPHMYFYVEFNFKANMFFILTIIQFGKLIFPILMGKLLKISPKWEEILKSAYFSPKSGKKWNTSLGNHFWGVVGMTKWSPFLVSCALSPSLVSKSGHFFSKVPIFGSSDCLLTSSLGPTVHYRL